MAKRVLDNIDYEVLKDLYYTKEMSQDEVATILGCSRGSIRKAMKRFDLRARSHSEVKKGERHPLYGKHHSNEARKKMSEAHKGERHPFYGKHLSEETRKKLSEAS